MDQATLVQMFEDGYRAFEEGDFDSATSMFTDDFVLVRPDRGGEIRGRDAVRSFYEPDAFVDMRFDLESIDIFGDVIVVSATVHATGRSSGIAVSQSSFQVWWMRGDQVFRSEAYTKRSQAFEAAGVDDPAA